MDAGIGVDANQHSRSLHICIANLHIQIASDLLTGRDHNPGIGYEVEAGSLPVTTQISGSVVGYIVFWRSIFRALTYIHSPEMDSASPFVGGRTIKSCGSVAVINMISFRLPGCERRSCL